MEISNAKQEFNQTVIKRLNYAMTKLGYTQTDLVKLCSDMGFHITQSTLSKLLSSGAGLSLMNLTYICRALHLDLNEVLSPEFSTTNITLPHYQKRTESSSFIKRADDKSFIPYLGEYHCYFFPTKSSETDLIEGIFKFEASKDYSECNVYISFKTKKRDEKKQDIIKEYWGKACISLNMDAIYCSVANEEIGECCYLIFSHIPILYEKLECRLGAVLTSSAGSHRLPTMQRILISRRKLSPKDLYLLEGQLLLNASEIIISQSAYQALLKDPELPASFIEYFCDKENNNNFSNVVSVPYYYLYESFIRDSFINTKDKLKIICLLRKYSLASRYNKIGGKADELVYRLLCDMDQNEDNVNAP